MAIVNSPLPERWTSPVSAMLPLSAVRNSQFIFEITHQVLPTVAKAHITDGSTGKTSAACHDKVNVFALGADEFRAADFRAPPRVAGATTGNVRSQQCVD